MSTFWSLVTNNGRVLDISPHDTESDAYERLRANFLDREVAPGADAETVREAMERQPTVIWTISEEALP